MAIISKDGNNALIISDLQIPFEHSKAFKFCAQLKSFYKIKDENVFCTGDEVDVLWASHYDRDPNGIYSPITELRRSIATLKEWQSIFPKMMICESNHGMRIAKKAFNSGIPQHVLKDYRSIFEHADGWKIAPYWRSQTKHKFIVQHGDQRGLGSQKPHVTAALKNGLSTCLGHFHSMAVVERIETQAYSMWAAIAGCLINRDAYAFQYSKSDSELAKIGTIVVLDDGARAEWIPLK